MDTQCTAGRKSAGLALLGTLVLLGVSRAASAQLPGLFEPPPALTAGYTNSPYSLAAFQDPQNVPPRPPGSGERTDTYGEEPADYSLQFLRTQTVLLQPGEWQFDYGLTYTLGQTHFPDVVGPSIVRTNVNQRQLIVPFAFRYGVTDRLQVYADVPVGWVHSEVANSIVDINSNHGGIGDVRLGLNYLWQQGDYYSPSIVLTAQTTLPTGNPGLPTNSIDADLGSGVWGASAQALVIHTYDPVVVFWGGGYRYLFENDFLGVDIRLGQQISYLLGVGFAVNDRVTLSAALLGLFITETEVNGVGVPDTTQEPIRMRFSVTAWRNCRIVEPFAEIGMTDSAPAARTGVVWTY